MLTRNHVINKLGIILISSLNSTNIVNIIHRTDRYYENNSMTKSSLINYECNIGRIGYKHKHKPMLFH